MYIEILERFCKVNSLDLTCRRYNEDLVEVSLEVKRGDARLEDETIDDSGLVQIIDREDTFISTCYGPSFEDACRWYVDTMLGKVLRVWRVGWHGFDVKKLMHVPDSLEALQIDLDLKE